MQNTSQRGERVGAPVGLAILLLMGILLVGFGYFQQHRIVFYAGLFVVLAGVLCGVVRMISHEND